MIKLQKQYKSENHKTCTKRLEIRAPLPTDCIGTLLCVLIEYIGCVFVFIVFIECIGRVLDPQSIDKKRQRLLCSVFSVYIVQGRGFSVHCTGEKVSPAIR